MLDFFLPMLRADFTMDETYYDKAGIVLQDVYKRQNEALTPYLSERYGKSKELRFINGVPLVPIGSVSYTHLDVYKRQKRIFGRD